MKRQIAKRMVSVASGGLVVVGGLLAASPSAEAQATTERVSVATGGDQANNHSAWASLSGDGLIVAFDSWASDLVPDDTNGVYDVFVHDRQTGVTSRISVSSGGAQASGSSSVPSISANGRFVAFHSNANNLVAGDSNGVTDVFVHDLMTGQTELVSKNAGGTGGNGTSYFSSISADGRYVAFESDATDLVVGDSNGLRDVFVHDRQTGVTTCVSENGDGFSYQAAISGDGRFVAFTTWAENFALGDTNSLPDVYVFDRQMDSLERVSVSSEGDQGGGWSFHPAISEHGDFVAFMSTAENLIPDDVNTAADVFVRDRPRSVTERVAEYVDNLEGLGRLSLSADGRFVAFASYGTNLVPEDSNGYTDVFVHDRATEVTGRVSLSSNGTQGNWYSIVPSISANGLHVAFESRASNLVENDTNSENDVFVRDSWSTIIFLDGFESGNTSAWSNVVQ